MAGPGKRGRVNDNPFDGYLLVKLDDKRPTHIMREQFLPPDRMIQRGGYLFAPPSLANLLGPSDSTVNFGPMEFVAWSISGEMH